MIDDIRPLARMMHLLFSFLAVLVVYWAMSCIYGDTPTKAQRLASVALSLSSGYLAHYTLDTLVEVP